MDVTTLLPVEDLPLEVHNTGTAADEMPPSSPFECHDATTKHTCDANSSHMPLQETSNWKDLMESSVSNEIDSEKTVNVHEMVRHGANLCHKIDDEHPILNDICNSVEVTEESVLLESRALQDCVYVDGHNMIGGPEETSHHQLSLDDNLIFPVQSIPGQVNSAVSYFDAQTSSLMDSQVIYQNVSIVPSGEAETHGGVGYVLVVTHPDLPSNIEPMPHSESLNTPSLITSTDLTLSAVTPTGLYLNKLNQLYCQWCPYTTDKQASLLRHVKTHEIERPFQCSICDRAFKSSTSLTNHVNTHNGVRPYTCESCPSAFTTSGELVRHRRYRHTFVKPHKCPHCPYASVELSKLKRHIRSHTGEKPYRCDECSYASPDRYKLKRHMRVHTGDKPYTCEFCSGRFTQSNSLKAHTLTHLKERPAFQCDICTTTCCRKGDLRIHMQKLHSTDKPVLCRRCDQTLPDRYTYKQHIRKHDTCQKRRYKCNLCAFTAWTTCELNAHLLTHSDDNVLKQVLVNKLSRRDHSSLQRLNACTVHKDDIADPNCEDCSKMLLTNLFQCDPKLDKLMLCDILGDPDIIAAISQGGKIPEVTIVHPDGHLELIHVPVTDGLYAQTETRTEPQRDTQHSHEMTPKEDSTMEYRSEAGIQTVLESDDDADSQPRNDEDPTDLDEKV